MIESIIVSAIMALFSGLITYVIAKHVINSQKDEIFDEILEYLSSPEGQQSIRNLGTIFAQGIGKGIGIGGSPLKGKTFGIPNVMLYEIWGEIKGRMGKKGEKTISEEGPSSSGGKF